MSRPHRTLPAAVVAFLALSAAADAEVIKVPGDYNTLQVAVNNATHGDVILIGSGFTSAGPVDIVDKALTLVVDGGGQAKVPQVRIRDLAPDHHVVVRGLGADGNAFPLGPAAEGLLVTDCLGRVTVEGSTFRGAHGWMPPLMTHGWPAARVKNSSSVALSHCLLVGGRGMNTGGEWIPPGSGAPALDVVDADVSVAFSELSGGDGGHADGGEDYIAGKPGGPAIRHDDGTLHLTGALLAGGDGGDGSCDFDPFGGGFFCGSGGSGGDWMELFAGTTAFHHGTTFAPGLAGGTPKGEPSEDGRLVDGAGLGVLLPSASRDFSVPAVRREGETAAFVFSGEDGDGALVWISLGPHWDMLPPHQGVFLVDSSAPVDALIALGPTGPAGELSISFTVPPLPSGLDAFPVHAQGLFLSAPGKLLLGPSSVLTLLDASF